MKNAIASLVLLISTAAHAGLPNFPQERQTFSGGSANLTAFRFQAGTQLASRDITSGTISVQPNGKRSLITINLFPAFHCPANMICAQVMPAPITFDADIKSMEIGACQETIYTAVKDQRPVDGIRVELKVVDNSTATCETLVPLQPTEVTLTLQGYRHSPGGEGGEFTEVHSFDAELLQGAL